MKKKNHHKLFLIFLFLFATAVDKIQAQDSAAASPVLLSLRYFLSENKIPYIIVNTKKKVERKFLPVKNIQVNVYFGEVAEENLLGKVVTAVNGEGRVAFPASLKANWDSLDEFKIFAESVPVKSEELLSADITIKKAILVIDTLLVDGVRTVTGLLKEKKGDEWIAVGEIEMKLSIKRLLGNLTVGEAETYTSDSTGTASAAFNKDSMPGDAKGNIILVARVEDNDNYGNLVVERSVPWGKIIQAETNFWHRTLWSTGNLAPIWLLVIAFAIIIGVWGTIIYLVWQLFKIKKMGKAFELGMST